MIDRIHLGEEMAEALLRADPNWQHPNMVDAEPSGDPTNYQAG